MKDNKSELDKIFNEKLNKENLDKFKNAVVDFINSKPEFKNNVVNLVLHLDEKTPHFHLALTPILNNRLTAKRIFTPEKARTWQDDFHKVLQSNSIVLERGKEYSPAIHQTLQRVPFKRACRGSRTTTEQHSCPSATQQHRHQDPID